MKKTLYSLMLNEEVVREIDRMAHRMGTNRSALINQILADYTSVMTPERRIESIFHEIEQLVAPARDLVFTDYIFLLFYLFINDNKNKKLP